MGVIIISLSPVTVLQSQKVSHASCLWLLTTLLPVRNDKNGNVRGSHRNCDKAPTAQPHLSSQFYLSIQSCFNRNIFLLAVLTVHASALLSFLHSKDTVSFRFLSSELLHNSQLVNAYRMERKEGREKGGRKKGGDTVEDVRMERRKVPDWQKLHLAIYN